MKDVNAELPKDCHYIFHKCIEQLSQTLNILVYVFQAKRRYENKTKHLVLEICCLKTGISIEIASTNATLGVYTSKKQNVKLFGHRFLNFLLGLMEHTTAVEGSHISTC